MESKSHPLSQNLCLENDQYNIAPTKVNLNSKGIDTNTLCVLFRSREESTEHFLWGCKFSKVVWSHFLSNLFSLLSDCRLGRETLNFLGYLVDKLEESKLYSVVIIIWELWAFRNKIIFKGGKVDLE